jgi:Flp pilus assembly pilin Flp
MITVSRLSMFLSCCLFVFFSASSDATAANNHNSTRSNRKNKPMDSGTDQGGSGTVRGNGTVKFFNESKGFGFSVADQEGSGTLRNNDPIPGIDIIVEKDPEDNPALENSVAMLYYQFLLEGASDSEAIEYGLIAALMGDSDSEAIEYGLIAALMGETPEDQPVDLDDKIVRKKPGRVGDGADLDGGSGNNGSGTLRNNDPIPGIDVIVEKDPEENNSLDNSPVMMLNEMLNAGYSQAEVVEFALATGLIGQ